MNELKCCDHKVNSKTLNNNSFGLWCAYCGRKGEGASPQEAFNNLKKSNPQPNKQQIITLPSHPSQLKDYTNQQISRLKNLSAPFVSNDKTAFEKMLERNIRYVVNQKSPGFIKAWQTEEGQESILQALENAYMLGASLPEMGSIVPFGEVVEFIPSFEAFEFALTNGKSAPFDWIMIEPIYEHDEYEIGTKTGEFYCNKIKQGQPRGDIIQVAVYGKNKKFNMIIGEVYDVDRLMKKAEQHSISYKYYLRDLKAWEHAEENGLLKNENGSLYMEKIIPKKGGGNWTKKIYKEDINSPYGEADKPEMLKKMAAKSFLRPFIKVRNSEAAYQEQKEKNLNDQIEDVFNKMPPLIEDAQFEEIQPEKEPEKPLTKDDDKIEKDKTLFPEEKESNTEIKFNQD